MCKSCPYCEYFKHGQCQSQYIHEVFMLKEGLNPKHFQTDRMLAECPEYASLMN